MSLVRTVDFSKFKVGQVCNTNLAGKMCAMVKGKGPDNENINEMKLAHHKTIENYKNNNGKVGSSCS